MNNAFFIEDSNYPSTHSKDDISQNYIFGYKKLADMTAETLSSKGGCRYDDTVRLPMLFLYRHYIELRLKGLYTLYNNVHGDESSNKKTLNNHKISHIWEELQKLIVKQFTNKEDLDPDLFESIDLVVFSFSKYDDSAQFFRYDKNNKGKPHLSLNFMIDYEKLSSAIDSADDSFDAFEYILNPPNQY